MIRSYSYAAYAALFAFSVPARGDVSRLEPWADTWQHWAADAFLNGYIAALEDAPLLPRDDASRHTLLSAFVLDKALDELRGELNERPEWARIPVIGIRKFVGV